MKRIFKKSISVLLAITFFFCSSAFGFFGVELAGFAVKARTVERSETKNGELTWTLNTETGELVIGGKGEIPTYFREEYLTFTYGQIKSITIEPGVTGIGQSSFDNCYALEKVVFSDTVKSIGVSAFAWCGNLTSIVIPDSVESIGFEAFSQTGLTDISIGKNVSTIEPGAFYGTPYLVDDSNWKNDVLYIDNCLIEAKTSVNGSYIIEKGTRIISDQAFAACSLLEDIIIPDSVVAIGGGAFSSCVGLTDIIIPDSVIDIGDFAFLGCENLKSIKLSDSLLSMGRDVFDYTALYNIEPNWENGILYIDDCLVEIKELNNNGPKSIKEGTKLIADYAFYNCINLGNVSIPVGVKTIGNYSFSSCLGLTNISIPDSLIRIGECAFEYCPDLTDIEIPKGVIDIGSQAFRECCSLSGITVDNANSKYSSDEYGVLFNKDKTCLIQYPSGNKLQTYTIPDSVVHMKSLSFHACSYLENVTIPDGVKSMGDNAFWACKNLESVVIGNGITAISHCAFDACINLKNIEFGKNIVYIGGSAFFKCGSLTDITIPDSVKIINGLAFAECDSLKNVIISNGVTSIGGLAFSGCDILENINIGSNVENIGYNAFEACNSLVKITVDPGNKVYSNDGYGVLFSKDKTALLKYPAGNTRENYVISDNVYNISEYAFTGCSSLKNVTVGKGISYIYEKVFDNCKSLTSITIPNNVKAIHQEAFNGCDNLKDVYFIGTEEEWSKVIIRSGNDDLVNATIHFTKNDSVGTPTDPKPSEPTTKPEPIEEEFVKKPSTSTVKYGETLILHADFANIPEGATIEWSVDGKGVTIVPSADGKTCAVTSTATGDVTITAKYVDADGVEHISEQEIKSNASFWQKIVSFFKNLFGISRIIEQAIKF